MELDRGDGGEERILSEPFGHVLDALPLDLGGLEHGGDQLLFVAQDLRFLHLDLALALHLLHLHLLGGHLRQIKKVNLPGVVEDRYLVTIDKVAATPPQYPRRVGVPGKRPL